MRENIVERIKKLFRDNLYLNYEINNLYLN